MNALWLFTSKWGHNVVWKTPDTKAYMLYDYMHLKYKNKTAAWSHDDAYPWVGNGSDWKEGPELLGCS